jgi:hypothetical protein
MFSNECYDAELDCRIDVILLDIKFWEWQADNANNELDKKFAIMVMTDKMARLHISLEIKKRRVGMFWFNG